MCSNNKYKPKKLENYIQKYLRERISYHTLKTDYGLLLSQYSFNNKVLKYQEHGILGIQANKVNNRYSTEFKHSVVMEHLKEGITVKRLACKYNIPSASNVTRWIIKHTKDKEIGLKIPALEKS